MLTKSSYVFFLTNQNSSASFRVRYHLSVLRVWALVYTTPATDEHLILYFSIDSSTVRTRLEGGSREARDVDAGGWGDEGANVINYPSNDSDWWAAGQVQPGRNSVEVVTATNEHWNRVIHTTLTNSNKDHLVKIWLKYMPIYNKKQYTGPIDYRSIPDQFSKMYYQKYDYIGKRHFFTFLIAISVAEMHNGRYCLCCNWNKNIFFIFCKYFFPSSLIYNEREIEREIDQKYLEGLSICEHHFGISFLKRENELFQWSIKCVRGSFIPVPETPR